MVLQRSLSAFLQLPVTANCHCPDLPSCNVRAFPHPPKPPKPIKLKTCKMRRISHDRPPPNPLQLTPMFAVGYASKRPVFRKKPIAQGSPKPPNPFKLNLRASTTYTQNGTAQTHCGYLQYFQSFRCRKGLIFQRKRMASLILVSNRPRRGMRCRFTAQVTSGSHSRSRARRSGVRVYYNSLCGRSDPRTSSEHDAG
jgi:hypothetical protein